METILLSHFHVVVFKVMYPKGRINAAMQRDSTRTSRGEMLMYYVPFTLHLFPKQSISFQQSLRFPSIKLKNRRLKL
jgi:hypothetical protein